MAVKPFGNYGPETEYCCQGLKTQPGLLCNDFGYHRYRYGISVVTILYRLLFEKKN